MPAHRPETDSTDNAEGTTALHAALAHQHWACAKLLLERGAQGREAQARLLSLTSGAAVSGKQLMVLHGRAWF